MTLGLAWVFSRQIVVKGCVSERELRKMAILDLRNMHGDRDGRVEPSPEALYVDTVRAFVDRYRIHDSCFDRDPERWMAIDAGMWANDVLDKHQREGRDPVEVCRRVRECCFEAYPYADFAYWVYSQHGGKCGDWSWSCRGDMIWGGRGILWVSPGDA